MFKPGSKKVEGKIFTYSNHCMASVDFEYNAQSVLELKRCQLLFYRKEQLASTGEKTIYNDLNEMKMTESSFWGELTL